MFVTPFLLFVKEGGVDQIRNAEFKALARVFFVVRQAHHERNKVKFLVLTPFTLRLI